MESGSQDLVCFARTNFRERRPFGIRRADRRAHTYIIGKTGTGKSTLLETLMRQDLAAGDGLALLDPHGDLIESVLTRIPEHRKRDLVYFDVPDAAHPLGFNPLESVSPEKRPLAASGLLEVFKKMWAESWGPRLEHILRNALLALLDLPEATLADILRMLDDRAFRRSAAGRVANANVRSFWLQEFENYPARFRLEAIAPIQNKVGAFVTHPVLQRIFAQRKSAFNIRQMMDAGKILLVNLGKGRIGEDAATLLGCMLVSSMGLAGLSRVEMPESERRDFYVYLDEFQNFTTLGLATMLSELRKYRVNLILAHQYLAQLELPIREAVLGNAGTIIAFRVGSSDALILEREFTPEFEALDLVNLPNHSIYLKLMVDGAVTRPFSAETLKLKL